MATKVKGVFAQGVDHLVAGLKLFTQAKGEAIATLDIQTAYAAEKREEEIAQTVHRSCAQMGYKVPAEVQTIMDRITVRLANKKGEAVAA